MGMQTRWFVNSRRVLMLGSIFGVGQGFASGGFEVDGRWKVDGVDTKRYRGRTRTWPLLGGCCSQMVAKKF